MEGQIETLFRQVEGANMDEAGVIRFSLPLNVMAYGFANDIRRFQELHPKITFEVDATDEAVDFANLEADVVLRVGENPAPSLWGFKIATVGVSFFASQNFMEIWRENIENNPLNAPIPYIEFSTANPAADRDEFLARFPKANVVSTCNGMDSLVPMMREGLGAGRMMRYMARAYPDLVKIFDCSTQWSRSVWILTHRDFRETKRVRLFMEFVKDRLQSRGSDF